MSKPKKNAIAEPVMSWRDEAISTSREKGPRWDAVTAERKSEVIYSALSLMAGDGTDEMFASWCVKLLVEADRLALVFSCDDNGQAVLILERRTGDENDTEVGYLPFVVHLPDHPRETVWEASAEELVDYIVECRDEAKRSTRH